MPLEAALACAVPLLSAALSVNNKSGAPGLCLFIVTLRGNNENWMFPAGVSQRPEKSLEWGKASEGALLVLGCEVLLSSQWTGDPRMGTSPIPNLKDFSILCFSQHFLWNCVIPVNGFQFLGADTSHQGWFIGNCQPSQQLEAKIVGLLFSCTGYL